MDATLPTEPNEIFLAILAAGTHGADLVPLYHQLREAAPQFQADLPRLSNPWVITRYADDQLLVRNTSLIKDERQLDLLGRREGKPDGPFLATMAKMFAFIGPPRHMALRGLVNRGFTPRSVEKLDPKIAAAVDRILEDEMAEGGMDLAPAYANRIPLTVICQLLGVPVEEVPTIAAWSSAFSERGDEGDAPTEESEKTGDDAARQFAAFIRSLVEERRANPRDDLLSRLVAIQAETAGLSDDEIVSTAILLFQAGHETTANMIAKGTLALLHHPEQYALLCAEPERVDNAVEELLRYDTPVQLTNKFAAADIPFHDTTIEEGATVTFLWGAVNHDPARYRDPDRLDITREDIDHHSFGMGAHFCLGSSLARLELRHAFRALSQRLPSLRLAGEPVYKPQLHVHGLRSLPVAW
jgi:cytochrome P450